MSKSQAAMLRKIKAQLKGTDGRRFDSRLAAELADPDRFRNVDSRRAAVKLLSPSLQDRAAAKAFAALLVKDEVKLGVT